MFQIHLVVQSSLEDLKRPEVLCDPDDRPGTCRPVLTTGPAPVVAVYPAVAYVDVILLAYGAVGTRLPRRRPRRLCKRAGACVGGAALRLGLGVALGTRSAVAVVALAVPSRPAFLVEIVVVVVVVIVVVFVLVLVLVLVLMVIVVLMAVAFAVNMSVLAVISLRAFVLPDVATVAGVEVCPVSLSGMFVVNSLAVGFLARVMMAGSMSSVTAECRSFIRSRPRHLTGWQPFPRFGSGDVERSRTRSPGIDSRLPLPRPTRSRARVAGEARSLFSGGSSLPPPSKVALIVAPVFMVIGETDAL